MPDLYKSDEEIAQEWYTLARHIMIGGTAYIISLTMVDWKEPFIESPVWSIVLRSFLWPMVLVSIASFIKMLKYKNAGSTVKNFLMLNMYIGVLYTFFSICHPTRNF